MGASLSSIEASQLVPLEQVLVPSDQVLVPSEQVDQYHRSKSIVASEQSLEPKLLGK